MTVFYICDAEKIAPPPVQTRETLFREDTAPSPSPAYAGGKGAR